MSVERRGRTWRVRWRDHAGRQRARDGFRTKREAESFEAEVWQLKRTGRLDAGRLTVAELGAEWKELRAPDLAPSTREVYRALWNRHVLPSAIAGVRLRDLAPEAVERFARDLEAAGVGPAARRKTLVLLGTVLQRGVERGLIASNPVRAIRKPPAGRARLVRPPTPEAIEALRARLSRRDASLISVLAYAGLRPQEALALVWGDVRERTLVVSAPKTGTTRAVRLLAPVADDLARWRRASGNPPPDALVFPSRRSGQLDWRNWRRRVWEPAAAPLGLDRPYDLRHAFVSLLIAEGATVLDVARQAGHSPTMTLSTYGHVFDEFEGAPATPAAERIATARAQIVPTAA